MVKRCCFTLLEVLVALSVLMLGFGFLMGQQALSSGRLRDAGEALARTRELTNAMVYSHSFFKSHIFRWSTIVYIGAKGQIDIISDLFKL